jgi:hypothetical protein
MIEDLLRRNIYQWRLQSIQREVSENFSLLRRIKNERLLWTIEYLDSLIFDEKVQFLESIAKFKANADTLQELGIELSKIHESYKNLYKNLQNYLDQKVHSIYLNSLTLTKNGLDKELTPKIIRQVKGIPDTPRATFSRLNSKLVKPLTQILGEPEIKDKDGFTFKQEIHENIFLDISSCRGGYMQISLMQSLILPPDTNNKREVIALDLPQRVGIGGGTTWDLLTIEDYDDFRETVILLINELLEGLTSLLDRIN